ncbi:MGH1-like glycoside hydrolase domain-containing protein [Streptomyces xiamenensis]|uniref:Mannosylglycerate hydrolase MGH1-like glycoside hydrolase domain-containing protein n=1 Tax=Streptomyces xiamenensis TaxID=408015 RepID=A0A0F7FRH6_9ACTN|nr:hypothetical protein SXIM_14490 [Streptomyces xiamenensis]
MERAEQTSTLHPLTPDAISAYDGACHVLLDNWTGSSTIPSHSLYPHQWSWDSGFIAIGQRHLSPLRAQQELETLLAAQWGDGRIPHIVFHPEVPLAAYFPSPDFWRSTTAGRGAGAGAPTAPETSGIVQPPIHALAAWLVHQADPDTSQRRGFLVRVYPKLAAWQRYLTERRDLGGHGLASIVHPWESGMDNSPSWDQPLAAVPPAAPGSFTRADLAHGAPCDRPTDLDYRKYVRLALDYRDHGYRDDLAPHPFAVEDPAFNALLIASEHALAEIAMEIGEDSSAHLVRAEECTAALRERLWDEDAGQFFSFDVRAGSRVRERSAAGLIPLIVPGLPAPVARALIDTLTGPHFGLGDITAMAPSYALTGAAFDASRYWRGPAWFNVNWLLERGLRRYGQPRRAAALRAAMLRAAVASDFTEYVDPYTGAARGSRDFGWTAALTIDLLAQGATDSLATGATGTTGSISSTSTATTTSTEHSEPQAAGGLRDHHHAPQTARP